MMDHIDEDVVTLWILAISAVAFVWFLRYIGRLFRSDKNEIPLQVSKYHGMSGDQIMRAFDREIEERLYRMDGMRTLEKIEREMEERSYRMDGMRLLEQIEAKRNAQLRKLGFTEAELRNLP